MQVGYIVRLRNWRSYTPKKSNEPGISYAEMVVPNKDEVGIFVFFGTERKDGQGPRVVPDEVLKNMGWTPPLEKKT